MLPCATDENVEQRSAFGVEVACGLPSAPEELAALTKLTELELFLMTYLLALMSNGLLLVYKLLTEAKVWSLVHYGSVGSVTREDSFGVDRARAKTPSIKKASCPCTVMSDAFAAKQCISPNFLMQFGVTSDD